MDMKNLSDILDEMLKDDLFENMLRERLREKARASGRHDENDLDEAVKWAQELGMTKAKENEELKQAQNPGGVTIFYRDGTKIKA